MVRLIVVAGLIAGALAGGTLPASATPRWSIMRTPSPPGPPNGSVLSVSCAGATDCVALGEAGFSFGGVFDESSRLDRFHRDACASRARCLAQRAKASGVEVIVSGPDTLVQHWDGTGWSIIPGPAPSVGNAGVDLVDISCPVVNTCFAAGSIETDSETSFTVKPLVERWNGSSWSVVPSPSPKGSGIAEFNGISCASPTSCVAVGDRSRGSGDDEDLDIHPLIERWNGTTWTISAAPIPSGSRAEILLETSCSDASNCTAVGAYLTNTATKQLVERTTGGAWSPVAAPTPAGQDGAGFESVACSSATACFAVGSAFTGTGDPDDPTAETVTPLAARWNGATWSLTPTPPPAGQESAELLSVACASASDCMAVGDAFSLSLGPSGGDTPLEEHWNGVSWAIVAGPTDSPFGRLAGVDCPSATACFAVGDSALIERWNGSAWSITPFAFKASQSSLADVACMSATNCFAVGTSSPAGTSFPLIEHWNGSQWRIMAAPVPNGSQGAVLSAISCPTATSCTAVGSNELAHSTATLVEHWNGSSWNVVPSPSPKGAFFVQLNDISCGAPKSCVALGLTEGNRASTESFAMQWSGYKWSMLPIPTPDFAESTSVASMSCLSRNKCFAVGTYIEVTGTRQLLQKILLLRWNGYRFRPTRGARIPGAPKLAQLTKVSCWSPTGCLAVGSYASSFTSPIGGPLYEQWNGTNWRVVPSDSRPPFSPSTLDCRSGISCYALGTSFSRAGIRPAVAHWNGRAWANVSIQKPAAQLSLLSGLDCPSPTLCFAAGSYQTVYGSFTLVLRGT